MKKPFAVRGSLLKCIVPTLLLMAALYSVITASVAASAGESVTVGVFDIIRIIAEVI